MGPGPMTRVVGKLKPRPSADPVMAAAAGSG
jgi:hypothetical protein